MQPGLRGQAESIMTANDDILVSGEGARLAGLGFGPGDAVPELGFFYPVDELRPAVRAQIQGNQLLRMARTSRVQMTSSLTETRRSA